MASEEADINPFELLGVGIEATDGEIRTAYRKVSLKVHPDRNPNNPQAAQKFHELNQAYELLLDPLRRLALTSSVKAKEARKARFSKYDVKRKNLQEELEERERAFKKQRLDKAREARERDQANERIKEEGRKMVEERQKEAVRRQENAAKEVREETQELEVPQLGSLDTTIKVKFIVATHPTLTTPSSVATLFHQFGEIDADSVVISIRPSKKAPNKRPRYGTSLIPFKQIGAAFAAVCASGRVDRGLKDVEISWAEGKEPPILEWLKKQGKLGGIKKNNEPETKSSSGATQGKAKIAIPDSQSASSLSKSFSSFPESFPDLPSASTTVAPGLDYESVTLMRLRQAERERLEREIRESEAAES